jgi:hypothetical protein
LVGFQNVSLRQNPKYALLDVKLKVIKDNCHVMVLLKKFFNLLDRLFMPIVVNYFSKKLY